MKLNRTSLKKRGAALVEYGLLIAGVALICAAAISIFGHKTNDLVGSVASVLPSNDVDDTGSITGGRVIMTAGGSGTDIAVDWNNVTSADNTTDELFGDGAGGLITDLQNN